MASFCCLAACTSSPQEELSRREVQEEGNDTDDSSPRSMTEGKVNEEPEPNEMPKSDPIPAVADGPIVIPATVTVTPRKGSINDDKALPKRGGLILMGGGTDVDSAFVWAHDQITGDNTTRRGDVLVMRATGADGYDQYIYDLAPFNSVQTVIISSAATSEDLNTVALLINRAEFVFFAGGNQADYVGWRNSKLMPAVQNVVKRGGVVGGTSAGLAILGQFVFDAITAGASNVTTADAVADPFAIAISFTRNMLGFPSMQGIITDTHFAERDRFGRLTTFMARQVIDGAVPPTGPITGLGVSEGTAILVDVMTGRGIRATDSVGAAFFIRGAAANRITKGQTLLYNNLSVIRLDADGQYYDFAKNCGTGPSYTVSVDGSAQAVYEPVNVYTVAASNGTCL
jgi:cyanophycinase-like exopeptidase